MPSPEPQGANFASKDHLLVSERAYKKSSSRALLGGAALLLGVPVLPGILIGSSVVQSGTAKFEAECAEQAERFGRQR